MRSPQKKEGKNLPSLSRPVRTGPYGANGQVLQQPSLSFLVSNQDNLDINQRTQELRFKKD